MPKMTIRFYEELNDFLPKQRRKVDFEAPFKGKRSIKDMLEALGVPHTEVDLILVDGNSVDFNYILQDEDRVSVYPVFEFLQRQWSSAMNMFNANPAIKFTGKERMLFI